jgi:putative ABC transport system permease protein
MLLFKILFRNAFRNKLRTGLTILGISVAILSFGMIRTVISAWYAGVDASSASRLIIRNSISLIFTLPLSYYEKIRHADHVKLVSYGNWFGGVYIEEKNFFPNFAVEPKSYLELYPEFILSDAEKKAFFSDRKSCVVGQKLAKRFGWKLGDLITLKGVIFPGNWEFVMRGIYNGKDKTTDETQFFFHWAYLNESIKQRYPRRADQIGFYMIGVDDPNHASEVSVAIDKMFVNSLAETLTESEKAFQMSFVAMSSAIVMTIELVSIVIIIIIMAVVANTMAMTSRERTGDYAVLKTLGFGSGYIATLIFGESFVITLTGCAIGMALTFPAAKAFGNELSNFFPIFNVENKTLIMDVGAALIVGFIAAIIPTWHAIRIRIAEGLRRIG